MARFHTLALLTLMSRCALAQAPYPPAVVQGVQWTHGAHHTGVSQPILSPGTAALPVLITSAATGEFVSGTSVHLDDGFHAGGFTGSGSFHAWIDEGMGPQADAVLVAPDPATHISGNVLHVNKWEKLEVGLRLPQPYQAAIDRFFAHYYANPLDSYVATPGNVDPAHDLNPYADDSLQVVMTLTKPNGIKTMTWGFFMREAKWASSSASARVVENDSDPLHPYHIRFRLAPDMEGEWQYTLSIRAPNTTTLGGSPLNDLAYTGFGFTCDAPLPDNHGPLHVNNANHRTLQFEDGTPYFGLGTNMISNGYHDQLFMPEWQDTNTYRLLKRNYDNIEIGMAHLHSAGGNLVRMFLMDKGFSPENVNIGVYDRFSDRLSCGAELPITGNGQYQCWVFDQILDSARGRNINIQLCLVPYPPIIDYETFTWGHDAYLHNFVLPRLSNGLFDMKRYFYSGGNTANTSSGAFYYWKRKYKYILSRWGWSVNIPILEPFNEIDQMLTYRHVNLIGTWNAICAQDKLDWLQDPALPATYSQWLTDIISYVKGAQDLSDPVHSPLGYGKKLFLAGTGPENLQTSNWENPVNPNWNLPNKNPNVDLVDVHHGMYWGEGELSNSFSESQTIHNAYRNSANGTKRPFHQGESNYYQIKDVYGQNTPNDTVHVDAAEYFDNYDVSFHNELWASTFFGNFAAATTWQMNRVFWWENGVKVPPKDNPHVVDQGNLYQWYFSNALGDTNLLDLGAPYPVVNKPIYHNFIPLADFLNNPNLQGYNFFNGNLQPHKVYDDANKLECYYLTNQDSAMAIGWVHNLNAYWEKHYYLQRAVQNYLGCTAPSAQSMALPGFQSGVDYHISWFPTRMNDTIPPADATDQSGTGTVLLNMSTAPLGGIAYNYLDTLHADYAFIVALQPVHRNIQVATDDPPAPNNEEFGMYPNPARNTVTLVLPSDGLAKDVALYDLTGHCVLVKTDVTAPVFEVPTGDLARGAYCVRVSDPMNSKVKTLILR
ncbi:MAG: T9SS type A sorting domain-containing protein [Bacteroidetes bacterium]|nr:T9SS type A sorting domain-containing protein [Bacteroidota bacterium]